MFNLSREEELEAIARYDTRQSTEYLEKHRENVRRAIDLMAKLSNNDFLKYMEGYAKLLTTTDISYLDK